MDATDRSLINALLGEFPVSDQPYADVAKKLGLGEADVIERLQRLRSDGVLTRFGPLYDATALGGAVTLCAMSVPEHRFDEVAGIVNAFAEVAHNYERQHSLNMWFVLATERIERIGEAIAEIEQVTGIGVLNLPKLEEYFLELRLTA